MFSAIECRLAFSLSELFIFPFFLSFSRFVGFFLLVSRLTLLQKLKEDPKLCPPEDPNRLEIIEESGYRWDTYSDVINRGYLNHLSSNGRIKHKDGRSLNVEEVSKNSSLEGAEFESEWH